MTKLLTDNEQLKAFIYAAQYFAGLTARQDIWDEAGKVLIKFFGADFAAFGRRRTDGSLEIGHWVSSGEPASLPGDQLLASMEEVMESGFLTYASPLADNPAAAAFLPVLHENRVIAVMLAGLSSPPLGKNTLDLYLAVAGLIGATYSRRLAELAVLEAKEELEERVARRTAELEAANKELEAFAYSVSHDLRTPLRSLNGFSQQILEDYLDKLDEEGRDALHRIRAASQRMGLLIDDLLNLSRISRSELVRKKVDLSRLAERIAADLAAVQPDRSVDMVISQGIRGEGDERLLDIVLQNLLGNAWKFTEKTRGAKIEFGEIMHNGMSAYFVRDNGAGFDMAYADKLFSPFQRLHSDDEFSGTGIGLATIHRIIQRHGGRVWAEGEPDRGATFYFTLK